MQFLNYFQQASYSRTRLSCKYLQSRLGTAYIVGNLGTYCSIRTAYRERGIRQILKNITRFSSQMNRGIKEDLGADWRISAISVTRNGFETSNIWGKWRRRISVYSETFSPPVTALLNIERWKLSLCLGTMYVECVTVEHRLFRVCNFTLQRGEVSPKLSCRFKSFLVKKAYGTHWTILWSGHRAGLSWWLGKTVW